MNTLDKITQNELNRQKNTLNLIASENYPSPKTLELLGSIWNDKYAEGYPGKRYYAGNIYADELEELTCQKALEVFDKTGEYGVNVQALSGSPANAVVYLTAVSYTHLDVYKRQCQPLTLACPLVVDLFRTVRWSDRNREEPPPWNAARHSQSQERSSGHWPPPGQPWP